MQVSGGSSLHRSGYTLAVTTGSGLHPLKGQLVYGSGYRNGHITSWQTHVAMGSTHCTLHNTLPLPTFPPFPSPLVYTHRLCQKTTHKICIQVLITPNHTTISRGSMGGQQETNVSSGGG